MNWLKRPSTTGGIGYLISVGVIAAGLAVVALGQWRTGATVMGLGFGFAFVVRLVLPDSRAGMLRVRSRLIDLALLALCSGVFLVLAVIIPGQLPRR